MTETAVVQRGHYADEEIFKPDGIYGRSGWRGIVAYLVGFAAMVPFFSMHSFTGPVAKAMGNADLSMLVGLPVSGILYLVLTRSIDVDAETRLAQQEVERVERFAREHRLPAGAP